MTGVAHPISVTPMPMTKTQVYFPPESLRALHRIAREKKRPVSELIREAAEDRWLKPPERDTRPGYEMIGMFKGPVPEGASSDNHDSAFDDID